jgi:hypothetical protein
MHLIHTYITSTQDLLKQLHNIKLPTDTPIYLFAIDIVNMYPNINNVTGIKALRWFLETFTELPPNEINLLIDLAHIILEHSYLCFKGKSYHQKEGTAMGTNFAKEYATIYLFYIFHTYYDSYADFLIFLKCFLDDGVGLWAGPHATLLNFINDLNNLPNNTDPHNNHAITFNTSNSTVDFMDITLFIRYNTLHYKHYTKPNEKHSLQLNSFHPSHTQNNWISNYINTLKIHSSTTKLFYTAKINFLTSLLKSNYTTKPSYNKKIKNHLSKLFLITNVTTPPKSKTNLDNTIFFAITNNPLLKHINIHNILDTHIDELPTDYFSTSFNHIITYKSPPNLATLICHKTKPYPSLP